MDIRKIIKKSFSVSKFFVNAKIFAHFFGSLFLKLFLQI
jgi:hypothetical protein